MAEKVFYYWNNEMRTGTPPLQHGNRELSALIGWGGVQIFDPGVDIVDLCYHYSVAVQDSSCGQCVPCRIGTRALARLFERIRNGEGSPEDLENIKVLSQTVSGASLCEIGQSSPRVFLYLLEHFADAFRAAVGKKKRSADRYSYKSLVTAPCMQACPIHLDIPKYIEEIRFGRFRESLDVIRQRLPLPGVLGRVCVRPCELNCRRALIDEPIQIKHLKRFVADQSPRDAQHPPEKETPKQGKVAIVGAGPSGLTCAYFLARKGYAVTIFELLPEPGGMAAVGIPDYRLPRDILRGEVEAIEKLGVEIVYGKGLGTHFTLDDLEQEGYKAVFIGMGCHCHKKMGVEGEDKGYYGYIPGVYFLRNVNLGLLDEIPKGKRMVVVGGGNVAIDCVRSAFRVGFEESHIVYRRSRKEMPADQAEIDDAEAEGVQFHFLTAPKRILGENGKVAGLECTRMELGEPDASGRRRPVEVPGSEFTIDAEVIVAAIGQEGDFSCMCNLPGVEVSKRGAIVVDENLMTTRKGVFAGGDCVTGPDVLIRACAHGRRVGLKIDRFLTEGRVEVFEEESDEKMLDALGVFSPSEEVNLPGGVKRMPVKHELPLERKGDFREVDKGFTPQEAVAEAGRCLRCYRVVTYAYAEGK
ncbi:MAG: FAD-dependent oxidoreductase [Alphaproteobacteria bacterium]|uniref:FAD-dependent oxidoreductase n=1 Tax=Candidatus Nitrobium versatile TaxID=2884831 RepID=A0A953J9B4_9BACT|nr:FAD-dependent oxidoreductase [Candidatus Nitrobium versatile]